MISEFDPERDQDIDRRIVIDSRKSASGDRKWMAYEVGMGGMYQGFGRIPGDALEDLQNIKLLNR